MGPLPAHVRLTKALLALGHPVTGCSGTGAGDVRLSFQPGTTPAQAAAAYQYAQVTFDWGAPAHAAWLVTQKKDRAKADYDDAGEYGRLLRAVALVARDEINVLRQWIMAFKAEVAAATSLANFQARIATLPNTPDRTVDQMRTAIRNRVDGES